MELKIFSELVNSRYKTVVKNIKSGSNSYYDSYLDLLESTIKYILDKHSISYNSASTCGNIIKESIVKEFIFKNLNISEELYDKLLDYIKKCNDHKHKKEKNVSLESIINQLSVYYLFINSYYCFIDEEELTFDKQYFVSIFKEEEKLNKQYKEEIIQIREELAALYKQKKIDDNEYAITEKLLSINIIEKLDLEEQNAILKSNLDILLQIKSNEKLEKRIIKLEEQNDKILNSLSNSNQSIFQKHNENQQTLNFLRIASKKYICYNYNQLKKYKKIIRITSIISILCAILSVIMQISFLNNINITVLFEYIYCINLLFIFIHTFAWKKRTDHITLSENSSYKFKLNDFFLYYSDDKEKTSYILLRLFSYIGVICSILCLLKFNVINIIIILLELAFMISTIINKIYKEDAHYNYNFSVLFTHKNKDEVNKSLVYCILENKYYSYDDFMEKYQKILKD